MAIINKLQKTVEGKQAIINVINSKLNLDLKINCLWEDIEDILTSVNFVSDIPVMSIGDVSTMRQLLTEENIGKIFQYTGETSGEFVTGALYQVTEV